MRKEKLSLAAAAALSLLCVVDAKAEALPGMGDATATAVASAQPSGREVARTIEGVVLDKADGEPLVGATILLKGQTGVGTRTDLEGKFTLTFTPKSKEPMLVVSYVGYTSKEVPVADVSSVKIELDAAAQSLNEVVVTGSGVQKKVSVTGAISTVSGFDLKSSTSSLTLNLAGKFAGVYANNYSGEPGTGADFYIRGISNFTNKSATPLILLDDVEISASDLNNIPAENIQSFSVLKDASATAIYGARGANGVMIITTKGGDYNTKTQINVNVENSFNFMGQLPDFVDGATYMEMYNLAEYSRNPLLAQPLFSEEDIERTRSGLNPYLYPDVNWQKVLFKNMAMRQRVNVNVSGGGNKVKYYMAIDFKHEDGHYKTEKRYSWNNQLQNYNYTFQNNISYKLTPSTTVSMNINAQIQQKTEPDVDSGAFFQAALNTNPIRVVPEYLPREGYNHIIYGTYKSSSAFLDNPWADMQTSFRQFNGNTVNAVVKIDQDLSMVTKGLKLNAWVNFKNYSASSYNRHITPYRYGYLTRDVEDWTDPIFDLSPHETPGSNYISQSNISRDSNNTFELQANVNWTRTFGQHELTAVAIYRMREYRHDVLPNRNQGISGRATYDFGHKYLVEFNFGYNGTERLAKGYRFGFFPAASLGWVVSSEKFWEPIRPVVSFLKIRGSYGLVGSDDMSLDGLYFFYYDQITNNNLSQLQWTPGAGGTLGQGTTYGGPQMSYYGLPTLGWEKVKKLDIGVDLRLFNDLNITLDYFKDQRYDILMRRQSWPISLGYGAAVPYGPVGRVTNTGFEGSVTYTKAITHDLSVSFNGNFTYNKNKLVDGDELQYRYPWLFSTGLPMSKIRGYICEGMFQSEEEIANSPVQNLGSTVMVGDLKYRDLNGDGQINEDDQTMISEYGWTPRLQYGFGATLNWKNWDFGFFFTGSAKRRVNVNGIDPFNRYTQEPNNMFKWIYESHFDPNNPDFSVEYPRMGVNYGEIRNNAVTSTHWVRNASFLRLRNLEVGWSFKYGRIYAQGNNLLLFTPFKYWDPEMSGWSTYPTQKTVTVGVQIKL